MIVTDVLGNQRLIERVYGDGSFDCPFCAYPVMTPGTTCNNPWCPAHPDCPPAEAKAIYAKREKAVADEARRKAEHARTMQRIAEEKQAREEFRQAAYAEARERGSCLRCLFDPYGRVKHIKHRGPCPKEKSHA